MVIQAVLHLDQAFPALDFQFFRGIHQLYHAIDEKGDAVTEFVSDRHIVRCEEDGHAFLPLPLQQVFDLAGIHRVQAGRGFVQEEQFWLIEQGTGNIEAHAHPFRKLGYRFLAIVCQPNQFQQRLRLLRLSCIERAEIGQVFQRGELEIVVGLLKGNTYTLIVIRAPCFEVAPEYGDRALVTFQQADENFLRGTFTRATGAEKANNLTTCYLQVDMFQCRFRATGIREAQIIDLYHVLYPHLASSHRT